MKSGKFNITRYGTLIIFATIFTLFIPKSVFASTIILSEANLPTLTDTNQEYQVKVSLSIDVADGTLYFLRGVFYKEGTNNYCGYTWNGSSWFSGPYSTNEGWKNFLSVTIASSSAVTNLKAKIDIEDSGCKESGNYNFKVQRFTLAGSSTFDKQNEQLVSFIISTPTLTPIPTAKPKKESTAKPKSGQVTETKLSSEDILNPTKIIPSKLTPTNTVATNQATLQPKVLGEVYNGPESTDNITEKKEQIQKMSINMPLVLFLILGGAGFILAAIIASYKRIRDKKL